VVWSSKTLQSCHDVEVAMLVDDLGLDACWSLFVALSEAFELSLIGLAPRSMVVAGWQQCSNYWCCDSLC
jgi:hypothetical protein